MAGFQDVHSVRIMLPGGGSATPTPGTITAGTTNIFCLRAPSAANGGGITIVAARSYSSSGDGAGSALTVALHRYSSTYAIEGTIASAAPAAGSAWPAGTPTSYTISDPYVDASEYVVANVIGTAVTATPSTRAIEIHYVMGQ